MVEIVYHVDLNEAQGDLAAAASCVRGPFDREAWFAMLAREALADTPCVVAIARDRGDVLALPLIEPAPRRLAPLANWYSFWWRPLGAERLLPALATALARRSNVISLHHLPVDDAMALVSAFRGAGWIAFIEPCDVNHVLELGGRSFAEYWAGRPGRLRETVRRKGRKGKVSLQILDRFEAQAWEDYEAVYRLSWKPEEGRPRFLRAFAEAEGAAGRLRLGLAKIDGRTVAAQFWTVEAGTAFIHKLAHDESAKADSPGTLLSAALFEHVIDRDHVALVDFGTGDDPYKRDWMEVQRQRYAVDLFSKRSLSARVLAAKHAARLWLRR